MQHVIHNPNITIMTIYAKEDNFEKYFIKFSYHFEINLSRYVSLKITIRRVLEAVTYTTLSPSVVHVSSEDVDEKQVARHLI